MIEVDASSLIDYLRGPGRSFCDALKLTDGDLDQSQVSELAWGVSNIVMRVDAPTRSFVVKQSRKQLRTQIDWFSRLDRIWREADVMRTLDGLLPNGAVPCVLFEDRDNYLFAMEAIAADHKVWKAELLEGRLDPFVSEHLAGVLAAVHRGSTNRENLRTLLEDRTVFDELRLDPFYRYMAQQDGVLAEPLNSLIDDTLDRSDCLVLADFSPKNILLTKSGPVFVDFETGHFGDPAFDIGFFLSHLLLKVVYHAARFDEAIRLPQVFWERYSKLLNRSPQPSWLAASDRSPDFERHCVRHLAACMLSRVAGKSRIDYLAADWQIDLVTRFCQRLLLERIELMSAAFDLLNQLLHDSIVRSEDD